MIDLLEIAFTNQREREVELFVYQNRTCFHLRKHKDGSVEVVTTQELNGPMEYMPLGIYDANGYELWPSNCRSTPAVSGGNQGGTDDYDWDEEPTKQAKSKKPKTKK